MNMMKWKIGVALVLLMLFLPMIANAEETTKVYSVEELEAYERDGWKISTVMSYTIPEIISERAEVGENVLIEGSAQVYMRKEIDGESMTLSGAVSNYPISFNFYKDDLLVEGYSYWGWGVQTDNKGNYKYTRFVPKEPGYYKIVLEGFKWEEWHPLSPYETNETFAIYVSEKDSDGDGVPDQYDYDPYDPNVQTERDIIPEATPTPKPPGFDVILAIIGLVTIAYFLRRKNEGK